MFSLTGGEFLLHPAYKEILTLFKKYDRKYILLTNGILADEVIETVKEFGIKKLAFSLDGPKDTYKKVRGVNNYGNIVRIVNELKDDTNIHIHYLINPWNTPSDLKEVINYCQVNSLELSLDVYQNIKYFESNEKSPLVDLYEPLLNNCNFRTLRNPNFIKMYNLWLKGKLFLPCWSIRISSSILPNGDVLLCQYKDIVLGNVYDNELNCIWRSEKTKEVQVKHLNCNSCWLGCQRGLDCNMIWTLARAFPASLLKRLVGPYDFEKATRCG